MTRRLYTPRGTLVLVSVRAPGPGDTPLSDAEVWHGLQDDLLEVLPLPKEIA